MGQAETERLEAAGVRVIPLEKGQYRPGAVTLDSVSGWQPVFDSWREGSEKIPSDRRLLIDQYRSWIYACADKNANAVATTQLRLYYGKKREGGKLLRTAKAVDRVKAKWLAADPTLTKAVSQSIEIVEIVEHPFLDLMENVNENMNGIDALILTETFLELCGEAYWLLGDELAEGIPAEFFVLPSQHVRPQITRDGRITGYKFGWPPDEVTYGPEQVVYFFSPSVFSVLRGYGPGHAAYAAAALQGKLEDFETALFENRATPAGLLVPENPLTESQVKQLLDEWNRIYKGSINAGKVGLAPFKLDFKTLALNPKEMTQLADRKIPRDEIAAIMGVPLTKLDMSKADASAVQGDITYARDAVLPRVRRLQAKINEKILPRYDDGLFCAFDNPIPQDRMYELQRAQAMAQTSGIVQANEVREAFGLDPDPELEGEMVERLEMPAPPFQPGSDMSQNRTARRIKAIRDYPLQRALRGLFEAQRESVLVSLQKSMRIVKAQPMFNWDEWVRRFYEETEGFIGGDIQRGGVQGLRQVPGAPALDFTLTNPKVAEFIQDYTYRFSRAVNATTNAQLQEVFLAAGREGQTVDEMADGVDAVFDHASRYRARMIARTEASRAVHAGQAEAWRESGVVRGQYWLAQASACEYCKALEERYGEGRTMIPLGGSFVPLNGQIQGVEGGVLQNSYADMPYPPAHPNCLCGVIAALIEE